MAKKNFNKSKKENRAVDANYKEVPEKQDPKATHEKGNYVISVVADGKVIKKIAVAGAEIYVNKLANGGLTVDLM